MGPHPFPTVVRDFQSVIGKEIKSQMLEKEGRLPDVVMVCVGGGSNAMGAFYEFIKDENVKLIGCEAAGLGADTPKTAATIATGTLGIFHGMNTVRLLQYIQFRQVLTTPVSVPNTQILPTRAEQAMFPLQTKRL